MSVLKRLAPLAPFLGIAAYVTLQADTLRDKLTAERGESIDGTWIEGASHAHDADVYARELEDISAGVFNVKVSRDELGHMLSTE